MNLVELLLPMALSIIKLPMLLFHVHHLVSIGITTHLLLLVTKSLVTLLTNQWRLEITFILLLVRLLLLQHWAAHLWHHRRIVLHVLLVLVLLVFNFVLFWLLEHCFLLSYQFFLTFAFLAWSNIVFVIRFEALQTLLISTWVDCCKHDVFLLIKREFSELRFSFLENWS